MKKLQLPVITVFLMALIIFTSCHNGVFFVKNKSTVKSNGIEADSLGKRDSMTRETVKTLFLKNGLEKHWNQFEPLIKDEIIIKTESKNENEIPIGQSRIGGRPDLPEKTDWFTQKDGQSLSFIAQINLKELANFNKSKELPDSGIIYFFYSAKQDAWGFDPGDADKFKIFYASKLNHLSRREFPVDLEEGSIYKPCILTFANSVSLPSLENELVNKQLNDKEIETYIEITENETINKLLGYSDNIQEEMEPECELATNGLHYGDTTRNNDPGRIELEKNAANWILLLQIDSEIEKTGMMWGDAGRLYFWIRKQDLKNSDFSKSWFALQCY